MKLSRCYSVSFDERNRMDIRKMMRDGGGLEAYARWEFLKQVLFDEGGRIDMSDGRDVPMLMEELRFDDRGDMDDYLDVLAEHGLIDGGMLSMGVVAAKEVTDEIERRRLSSARGRKGAAARWGEAE